MSMLAKGASFSYFAHLMPKITLLGIWGKYFPPSPFQEMAPSAKDRAREIAVNSCLSAPGRCLSCLSSPCRVWRWPLGRALLTEPRSLSLAAAQMPPEGTRDLGRKKELQGSRVLAGYASLKSMHVISRKIEPNCRAIRQSGGLVLSGSKILWQQLHLGLAARSPEILPCPHSCLREIERGCFC